MAEAKSQADLAFDELSELIREKDESGLPFGAYIQQLKDEATEAIRKVEVAERASNICAATKRRKPRSDKGTRRKPQNEIEENDAAEP